MNYTKDNADIIFCSSSVLLELSIKGKSFGCWFHLCAEEWNDLESVTKHLVKKGCSLFYFSGIRAKTYHDLVDDCLINMKKEDVLTAWGEGSVIESAEEFWDITNGYCDARIVSAVNATRSNEHLVGAELILALNAHVI